MAASAHDKVTEIASDAQSSACSVFLLSPRSPFQAEKVAERILMKNGYSRETITPQILKKAVGLLVVNGAYSPQAAQDLDRWLQYKRQQAQDRELLDLLSAQESARRTQVRTHYHIEP